MENKGEITTEYQVEAEETKVDKDEILVECKVETSNIVSLLMLYLNCKYEKYNDVDYVRSF